MYISNMISISIFIYCEELVRLGLEKEMAIHSSVLAWRIPGTGEPGGLPSMGSQRVRHDRSDLAAAAAAAAVRLGSAQPATCQLDSQWYRSSPSWKA